MRLYQRKEGGTWYYDVRANGKRKRVSTGTSSRKRAEEVLKKVTSDMWKARHLGERAPVLWVDVADAYNRAKQGQPSAEQNEQRLEMVRDIHLGVYLHQLSHREIDLVRTRMMDLGWKPSTMNRWWNWYRAVLNYGQERGMLPEGLPLPKIPREKEAESRPKFLTMEEVLRLEEAARAMPRSEHLADWITLAVETGLRKSNVTALRWEDIDMVRGTITFEGGDMKNAKVHHVVLSDRAKQAIRRNMGKHHTYVLTYRGRPFRSINSRTLTNIAERAGLGKRVTPHMMRHTFAMLHLQRGTPLPVIQVMGGWSSLSSMEKYLNMNEDIKRRYTADLVAPVPTEGHTSSPTAGHTG